MWGGEGGSGDYNYSQLYKQNMTIVLWLETSEMTRHKDIDR